MQFMRIIALLLVFSTPSFAAVTRGLRVVAKDPATNQSSEVKLYNKSYAVVIGIDKYPNLPPGSQLHNAVKDARGVEEALKKNYRFDKIYSLHNEQATKDLILELLTEELPAQMGKKTRSFSSGQGMATRKKVTTAILAI